MRQRVRALIIEDEKILFIHRIVEGREYWVIPGGGVEDDDMDLFASLRRECMEELGVEVDIGELFMESFFKLQDEDQHQHIFRCRISGGELGTGIGPEYQEDGGYAGSFEIEWLHRSEIGERPVLPEELKNKICEIYEDRP